MSIAPRWHRSAWKVSALAVCLFLAVLTVAGAPGTGPWAEAAGLPPAFSRAVAEEVIGAMVDAVVRGDKAAFLAQVDPAAATSDNLSEFSEENQKVFSLGIQWQVTGVTTDPPQATVLLAGVGWSQRSLISFTSSRGRWVIQDSRPAPAVPESDYQLDVTLHPEEQTIEVAGSYTFDLDYPVASLGLVVSGRLKFTNLSVDGRDLLADFPTTTINGAAVVPLAADEAGRRTVTFRSAGSIAEPDNHGRYLSYIGPEGVFVPQASWYPRLSMSSPGTRATARVTFHVPAGWSVACVGKEESAVDGPSGRTVTFLTDSVDAIGFTAGPYRRLTSEGPVPVSVLTLPANGGNPNKVLAMIHDVLRVEQELLGPYPFPTLTSAEEPENTGSCYAVPGLLIMAPQSGGGVYDKFIAHELAHQWLCFQVQPAGSEGKWWLVEGLANYVAALYFEKKQGPEGLRATLGRLADQYRTTKEKSSEAEPNLLVPKSSSLLAEAVIYYKGAWVFHQLRLFMGDGAFFSLLKGVVSRYSGKQMDLNDFLAMVTEKGGPDATEFLKTWLTKVGPLDVTLEDVKQGRSADGNYETTFRLVGCGDLPAPPTPVRIDYYGGALRTVVRPGIPFTAATPGVVWRMEVDPDHEVWDVDRKNNLLVLHLQPRIRLVILLGGVAALILVAASLALRRWRRETST